MYYCTPPPPPSLTPSPMCLSLCHNSSVILYHYHAGTQYPWHDGEYHRFLIVRASMLAWLGFSHDWSWFNVTYESLSVNLKSLSNIKTSFSFPHPLYVTLRSPISLHLTLRTLTSTLPNISRMRMLSWEFIIFSFLMFFISFCMLASWYP